MPTIYERINEQAERNNAAHHETQALMVAIHAIFHPPHKRRPGTGELYINWATATHRLNTHLLARRADRFWWENGLLWHGYWLNQPDETERYGIFNVLALALGMPHEQVYDGGRLGVLPNVIDRYIAVSELKKAGYR